MVMWLIWVGSERRHSRSDKGLLPARQEAWCRRSFLTYTVRKALLEGDYQPSSGSLLRRKQAIEQSAKLHAWSDGEVDGYLTLDALKLSARNISLLNATHGLIGDCISPDGSQKYAAP